MRPTLNTIMTIKRFLLPKNTSWFRIWSKIWFQWNYDLQFSRYTFSSTIALRSKKIPLACQISSVVLQKGEDGAHAYLPPYCYCYFLYVFQTFLRRSSMLCSTVDWNYRTIAVSNMKLPLGASTKQLVWNFTGTIFECWFWNFISLYE